MGGLTLAVMIALAAAVAGLSVYCLLLRACVRALSRRLEDFLSHGGELLPFSVREDALAPLWNAAAELENRLMLAKEHERDEGKRASNLTADISHQLKTPLASLRLFCEMDEGAHWREEIGQIERMEGLIHALLRLEKLSADGYEFVFADHDVGDVIRAAWCSLKGVCANRTLNVMGDCVIRCDEKWLGEAFLNLLKNACEHTKPDGEITVRMEKTASAFFCTIEDDGGGVPAGQLSRLFERFYRAPGQESGGVGIGLAIVREIVRRHHGGVYAENTAKGLRMNITLPVLNLAKS